MGLKDKLKRSPREISEKISKGVLPAQQLGSMSFEVINQELYSLQNEKPAFRDSKWIKRIEKIEESIKSKLSRNKNSIMCQVWLRDIERIRNQR